MKSNMNKFRISLILIVLVTLSYSIPAQLSLENVYPVSVNICELEVSGLKYYSMDITNKQCNIYNMNHSLYKNIPLTVPDGYYLYNVQFVSEKIFNSDDLIELVYTSSYYHQTETSYYYSYETRVINENSDVLLYVPGAGYTLLNDAGEEGMKFLVYVYDFSVIPAVTQTYVYDLPDGTSTLKSYSVISEQGSLGNPYPNPYVSGFLHIPVNLAPDLAEQSITIHDLNGTLIQSIPIQHPASSVTINPGTLKPGTYLINLGTRDCKPLSKKIVIE